jgi:integrase
MSIVSIYLSGGMNYMSFLYDQTGKRKYLTIDERWAFLEAAKTSAPKVYTFCATLAYTGARISEVLALNSSSVDFADKIIIIKCLKKRHSDVYRAVPVPVSLLRELDKTHSIQKSQAKQDGDGIRLWSWGRTTAWKHVKQAMAKAGLRGPHASPKGLRHSFGVISIQSQTPINMVRKWLGHSRISTTAIYADAVGEEERDIAKRFWDTFK